MHQGHVDEWGGLPFRKLDSWDLKTAFAGVFTASRTTQAAFRSASVPTHILCVPPPSCVSSFDFVACVSTSAHGGRRLVIDAGCLTLSRQRFATYPRQHLRAATLSGRIDTGRFALALAASRDVSCDDTHARAGL